MRQNVMTACDFNMCFTFILTGWEGSAHDATIFGEAITNSLLQFPQPSEGSTIWLTLNTQICLVFSRPIKPYHFNDCR